MSSSKIPDSSAGGHERARKLIARERVEGAASVGAEERRWLGEHLRGCEACARHADETEFALASVRGFGVELPRGLASRTQMRVRLRAEELRERAPGKKLLWAISAVSWALGVATAPWVWEGFAWVGRRTGAPKLVWELGFVLWWAVPALFAAGAVIAEKAGAAREIE